MDFFFENFLIFLNADQELPFDVKKFLHSCSSSNRNFLTMFVGTQAFNVC